MKVTLLAVILSVLVGLTVALPSPDALPDPSRRYYGSTYPHYHHSGHTHSFIPSRHGYREVVSHGHIYRPRSHHHHG